MKKAIYKITNKLNNKIYIGQSVNPENRWFNHKSDKKTYIGRALHKYGSENFNFEILEWTEDYDSRERYWIAYYNSYGDAGYNLTAGGEGQQRITDEILFAIREDILHTEMSFIEIAEMYDVSANTISFINKGKAYYQEGYKYPLRYKSHALTSEEIEEIEELLLSYQSSTIDVVAGILNYTRTLLYMINSGNHKKSSGKYNYPIVPYNKYYASQEEISMIEEMILTTKDSLKSIASQCGRERELISKVKNGKHRYSSKELQFPLR